MLYTKLNGKDIRYQMEKMKSKIYNIIASIMYFFRQGIYLLNPANGYFLVGNLDAFYLFAPMYLVNKFKELKEKNEKLKDIKISKTTIALLAACVIYVIIQIIFVPNINILRLMVNMAKIIVCYFVMKYVKEYYNRFDISFICKAFSILCGILLIIAIVFPNSQLWRHNDTINKYDLNRLQFLYTEPSELGLHAMPIILIYIFMMLNTKNSKKLLAYMMFTLPIIMALLYAKPLGAIGIGAISVVVLCVSDLIINFSKKKLMLYMVFVLLGVMLLGGLVITKSSIYLRIMDTFNGKDQSNSYRITVPFTIATQSIMDSKGIGIGLGNAELEDNVEKYAYLGLEKEGVINSYMNLIAEGGIFGLVLSAIVIASVLKKAVEEESSIKIALSVFIIIYQFMGTYFTNPLCWIIYGIILSDFDFKRKEKEWNFQ